MCNNTYCFMYVYGDDNQLGILIFLYVKKAGAFIIFHFLSE